MLTRWSDVDRTYLMIDDFQRRVSQMFEGFETRRRPGLGLTPRGTWPPVNMYDTVDALEFHALVPAVFDKDLKISVNQDVLTISGERQVTAPEGYSVHRQERGSVKFSRSFTLPCKCNMERVSATVKHGVLTLRMAKAPEAQPRQITVTTQE